jgi:pimeloyl-ACP methyl ester carboxylesterase
MKSWIAIATVSVIAFMAPTHAVAAGAASAQTRYVDVDGDRIAYRTVGSGSTIVLANRMRGTIDTWDPLFIDKLAEKHRVIYFDYPGVGYSKGTLPKEIGSAAAFVDSFATKMNLDRFVMAGWSWGGIVAQTLLVEKPGRATHVVLMATKPPGPEEKAISPLFIERAFNPVNDLADEEILFFEPASDRSRAAARASRDRIRVRPNVDGPIPSSKEEIANYLQAAQGFFEDRALRRTALLKSTTPMLIISGSNDISTPTENWYPLVGKLPRAQLVVLPESGHGPQHQYPELSARLISDFLANVR